MARITVPLFKDALKGTYGVQSLIAKKLGVDRATVSKYLSRNPKMMELCKTEREKIIDISENRLFKAANDGHKWAIDRILKTLGKNRGYVEKQEIELAGNISTLSKEEREAEIKRLLEK